MKFGLIVVGNELLNGKIQDLNTHFIAKKLYELGHDFHEVSIIGDDEDQFFKAMDNLKQKTDIILTCGGLGPTLDDKTKYILANYFQKEVKFSEKALETTLKHYQRHDRTYNQDKLHYHMFPEDFQVLENKIGMAPGLNYKDKDCEVFAMPGVPTELHSMFEEILEKVKNSQVKLTKHIIVKTWKVGESIIFSELAPNLWQRLETIGEVSSLPHIMGVDIGVKVQGENQKELDQKEKSVLDFIHNSKVKEYIWHYGPETLEEVIIQRAKEKNLKIGFSESCTGGLCASRITDISGSSSVFWGSIISYANDVKENCLNVSQETLKNHGAVSEQTALEMANGAREKLGVDIAVSTTGIAGPGGGTEAKPVGTVGIGISSKHSEKSKIYNFKGNRKTLKLRFSQKALMSLLEEINNF